jgi:hypothetical protein
MNEIFDPTSILDDIWSRLSMGKRDRAHPFYLPAVAITGVDGSPTVRTVVLREVDRAARLLSFQTDRRSPKVTAIRANPTVSWLFYDPPVRLQLRIKTAARIHTDDSIAAAAWAAVPTANQMNYLSENAPGTSIPTVYRSPTQWRAAGRENFAVVNCRVDEIDWLMIHPQGHRRLRFTFSGDAVTSEWLVP